MRPAALAGGRADPRAVGGRAVDRLRPQPADARRARAAVADGPRLSARASRARPGPTSTRSSAPRTTSCRPTTSRSAPELTIAHRTSPTNIGLGLLATLAAHDLGFIDTPSSCAGSTRRSTTVERLERHEGHLLNWYDTRTLAPLPPAYVSTVDSGNLAGALLTLSVGLRDIAPDARRARRPRSFDAMNFRFLFDPKRQLFAIGYRLADAESAGRLDASYYDLLASEARLASFIAIAKGDVPEMHWFHLGRSVTSVRGAPVLLSWSATLFEYLMPLLVMRSYPNTLLDESCRLVVRRQMDYAAARGVPWGISESAYNLVDRHGTYQYKAFGIPGLGLKRGLGDEAGRRAVRDGAGRHDRSRPRAPPTCGGSPRPASRASTASSTPSTTPIAAPTRPDAGDHGVRRGVVVPTYMAHHQGMTLVALANALLGDRMVERFHAEPRVQATELLLQERVPRDVGDDRAAPARRDARRPRPSSSMPVRRYRSPHTHVPAHAVPVERQLRHVGDQRRRRRAASGAACR